MFATDPYTVLARNPKWPCAVDSDNALRIQSNPQLISFLKDNCYLLFRPIDLRELKALCIRCEVSAVDANTGHQRWDIAILSHPTAGDDHS